MKKKLLVIICRDLFVRNYLRTNVFSTLQEKYDLKIIADEAVSLRDDLEAQQEFLGYSGLEKQARKKHRAYSDVLTYRYRNKSTSFFYRFVRTSGIARKDVTEPRLTEMKVPYRAILQSIARRPWKLSVLWTMLLGSRWIYPIYKAFTEPRIPVDHQLKLLIERVAPDLVLFPTSAHDPVGNDTSRICAELGITSLFLVDNWDNISSKSIFWTEPDYLGLWSEQQVEQADRIQGIPEDRTFIIGTPRFDQYFETRDTGAKSHFDFPYVVFAGGSLAFDELSALERLDQEMSDHPKIYGGTKLVYRPHPWRHRRKSERRFEDIGFQNVVLDPQMRDKFLAEPSRVRIEFQPALDYYPALLANAEFIVGPLTTFLIECQLFYKRYLGLCYDDGVHITSPDLALMFSEHLRGVERGPGLTLCPAQRDLIDLFRELFTSKPEIDRKSWDRALNYFICIDGTPYTKRLQATVEAILAGTTH